MSGDGPRAPSAVVQRVTGARHVRAGAPCQDEVGLIRIGDTLAVAVADGHGRSARADVGARLAVEVALSALVGFAGRLGEGRALAEVRGYAEHPLRVQIVRRWVERVRAHADDPSVPLVAYGSTLLFGLATPDYLLVGQLGDGDVLLADGEGVARPLPPDPRAFADETPSLCMNEAWQALRVRALPPGSGERLLVLATDGYGNSYPDDAAFDAVARGYLDLARANGLPALARHLPRFLETVTTAGSGDDISVALVHWPAEPPAEAATEAPAEAAPSEAAAPEATGPDDTRTEPPGGDDDADDAHPDPG